jgi:hypothetical protein
MQYLALLFLFLKFSLKIFGQIKFYFKYFKNNRLKKWIKNPLDS